MENFCPICKRVLGNTIDLHHWFPKTHMKGLDKGPTSILHRVCHQKIHSIWTERELYNYYNTLERVLENHEMQKFIKWVSKKEPNFIDINKETKIRKSKRRK